jgi:hypothetical protein
MCRSQHTWGTLSWQEAADRNPAIAPLSGVTSTQMCVWKPGPRLLDCPDEAGLPMLAAPRLLDIEFFVRSAMRKSPLINFVRFFSPLGAVVFPFGRLHPALMR